MYEYFKGKLIESGPQHAILEVHGIGYKLMLPFNTFRQMPENGQEVLLYSSFLIKDTSHCLYGFLSRQERDVFELLITVSGIGPKIAVSLLGHLELMELVEAIRNAHLPLLCKVPGIGKKTAERLILEVRDKIPLLVQESEEKMSSKPVDVTSQKIRDAMSALINLGYSQVMAQRAIKQAIKESDETAELAVLITSALQHCCGS